MTRATTTPPFVLTYYNPFDKGSPGLEKSFLNYIKDVSLANYAGSIAGKTTGDIVSAFIAKASREQVDALSRVSNELVKGFEILDQRLELVRLEQFNTNVLLKDITELLKLPDSEKKRQRHIELGMKFSKSALKNEDLIKDAIVEFNSALNLMSQDWFVMFQLAMCYMYFESIQNLELAEELFLKSAKYSSVDYLEDGTLGLLFDQSFLYDKQFENEDSSSPTSVTSECYLQLSTIRYIKADFVNALRYAESANKSRPGNIKCLFFLAKYQSRCGLFDEAISTIEEAGKIEPGIYKTLPADLDILSNPKFISFFEDFSKNQIRLEESKRKDKEAKEYNEILLSYAEVIYYAFDWFLYRKQKELDKVKERSNDIDFDRVNKLWRAFFAIHCSLRKEQNVRYIWPETPNQVKQEIIEYGVMLMELARTVYNENLIANRVFDKSTLKDDVKYRDEYWVSKVLTRSQILSLLEKYIMNLQVGKIYGPSIEYLDDHVFSQEDKTIALENLDILKLQKEKTKGACFIATATMGNCNHPVVMDLRFFRDNWLLQREWGMSFANWYYKHGSKAAKIIEKSIFLRRITFIIVIKPLQLITKKLK